MEQDAAAVNLLDENFIKKCSERMPDFGRKMEYMLNTGNLVSRSGLDLSQSTGFTVVAEKLNFFRCCLCPMLCLANSFSTVIVIT